MTLERRTPLRTKSKLKAKTPLRAKGRLTARRGPSQVSDKRRDRLVEYRQAVRVVDSRDRRRCQAASYRTVIGYCEGRPDQPDIVHHHRAGRDGDRLVDVEQIISLCPGHHEWVHAHESEARALGLMA